MVVAVFLLRVVLAVVFLRAGAVKLHGREEFRRAVENYRLLPAALVGPVAMAVPWVEVIAGGLLLFGVELRPVAVVLATLLVVFSVAVAVNLLRGRTFSCGCSGRMASDISWKHVFRNSVLAAAAVVVALWPAEPLAVFVGVRDSHESARWGSLALAWLLITTASLAGALLAVETHRLERIVRLSGIASRGHIE